MTKVTDFLIYIREMAGPPCASCHFYACPKQTFLCMLTKWTIIGNNFLISSSFSLRIVFGWEIFIYLFTFFFSFFSVEGKCLLVQLTNGFPSFLRSRQIHT